MNFVFQLTENCSTNPCDKGVCEMVNTTHPFSGVSFYYILEVILFILVSPCYQTAPVIYIITLKDTFHSIHSFVKDMPNVARIEKSWDGQISHFLCRFCMYWAALWNYEIGSQQQWLLQCLQSFDFFFIPLLLHQAYLEHLWHHVPLDSLDLQHLVPWMECHHMKCQHCNNNMWI